MRLLRSRVAVGVAALVIGAGAASAVTYAVADGPTTPDTYYACASATGVIRAGTIRLNVAPTTCPKTTDHVVSWLATGSAPAAPASRWIDLGGGFTLTEGAPAALPAADTSECAQIEVYTAYSEVNAWPVRLNVFGTTRPTTAEPAAPHLSAGRDLAFGETPSAVTMQLHMRTEPLSNGYSYSSVIPPETTLRLEVSHGDAATPLRSLLVDDVQLLCTPY